MFLLRNIRVSVFVFKCCNSGGANTYLVVNRLICLIHPLRLRSLFYFFVLRLEESVEPAVC